MFSAESIFIFVVQLVKECNVGQSKIDKQSLRMCYFKNDKRYFKKLRCLTFYVVKDEARLSKIAVIIQQLGAEFDLDELQISPKIPVYSNEIQFCKCLLSSIYAN